MVDLAKIYIWGEFVGATLWNEDTQSTSFEYDPDFGAKGWELSPSSPCILGRRLRQNETASNKVRRGLFVLFGTGNNRSEKSGC